MKAISTKGVKGLNNVLPPERMGFEFLQSATNIDIDDTGETRRRNGFVKKSAGDVHSLWSDGDVCLFREGDALKRLQSDMVSVTVLTDGLTTEKVRMWYLSLNGLVYFSDGIITGIYQDGSVRSWGLETPPAPKIATASPGTVKKGRYQVAATYVRSDGQESGVSMPSAVEISDLGGRITIYPPQPEGSDVTHVNIYVTTSGGTTLYLYSTVSAGSGEIEYDGGTVTVSAKTQGLSCPLPGRIIEYYNGRVYVASGNVVWASRPYAYELFDLRNDFIYLDEPVTLLAAVDDGIWIGTEKEIVFAYGDDLPFKRLLRADYGAVYGTQVKADASKVLDGRTAGVCVLVNTDRGKCALFNEGGLINLTEDRYSYPTSDIGAGLFRQQGGINQYISILQYPQGSANNKYG